MTNALVIVESPAKARTIAGYLGDGFVVESSIGHVRDLPRNAAEVPKTYRNEPWARIGIDVDNDFKPLYVVASDRRSQITKLKSRLAEADELFLATDEDREGEAIAWHLLEVLNPRVPVKRMVFHEITRDAIQAAVDSPRGIDRRMVDAQEARRLLDRLYGYEVSPVLWKKVMPQLSAGRVQSVAIRIVVERERERMDFVSAGYWSLTGTFAAPGSDPGAAGRFEASLSAVDGVRTAGGRDFGPDGRLSRSDVVLVDEAMATGLAERLEGAGFTVADRDSKPYRRRPSPPFITSTFQQEAARKLKMSATAAMRAAQGLYEKGYITYMRTDSTTLSAAAVQAARSIVAERYGREFLPPKPRSYAGKVKNAQEAHEAIRPAGDSFRPPSEVARSVPPPEARAYEIIYQRTLASQMIDCTGETVRLQLSPEAEAAPDVVFTATGTVITHPGFRLAYEDGRDSDGAGAGGGAGAGASGSPRRSGNGAGAGGGAPAAGDPKLPPLERGDRVTAEAMAPEEHSTQPPARFTEASLIHRLEELGVGRPSTYASIMGTILDRGYVWRKGTALVPSFTAFSVVNLLERHFPRLVDYAFTAEMEDDLDRIAQGAEETVPWLSRFYFGHEDDPGLKEKVSSRLGDIDARAVNSVPLGVTADGSPVEVRVGRYGPYVQMGDQSSSLPEDVVPDELTVERALELLSRPREGRVLGRDPATGLDVYVRSGRFGPYVQVGAADEVDGKPKMASLFKAMSPETVTLDEALGVLSLPRTVGADPADGAEVTAHNGRYGPYVKKGAETRSLDREEMLLSITLDECLKILSEPKRRRGQASARSPLRELGPDPDTGRDMVVKEGRYGPYVTDGEVNASLRKGDAAEGLTPERASELLAERRARGPAPKRRPAAKKSGKSSAKRASGGKPPAAETKRNAKKGS